MQRRRVQVALQLLQSRLGSVLRLAAVDRLAGQQEDALLTPPRRLGGGKELDSLKSDGGILLIFYK